MKKTIERKSKLFEIAESQQGFFTAMQAEECGYIRTNHSYYVKNGQWIRELRGIYRLALFPVSEHEQLEKYFLWSQNKEGKPQGIYSHETALNYYELSDLNPAKLHLTVPKSFRRNSEIPRVVKLHTGEISKNEVQNAAGFLLTKPLRTLKDVISSKHTSPEFIKQAIEEALSRGLIRREHLKELQEVAEKEDFFVSDIKQIIKKKAA